MWTFPIPRRQNDRPATRRRRPSRRPLVEDLEGRQLLSGVTVAIQQEPVAPSIVGKWFWTVDTDGHAKFVQN